MHARSHSPYVAIICYAILAVVFALTGTFAELAVLSALASAAFYIGGCAAVWKLARRGIAQATAPLNFRWLGTAVIVGIGSMWVLIAMASRDEIVGLFVLVSASAAVYLLQARMALKRGAPRRGMMFLSNRNRSSYATALDTAIQ